MRKKLKNAKRIVIKIGTSSLTHESGKLNLRKIEYLARVLTDIQNQGKEIVLVSSGAIGAGVQRLGLSKKPDQLEMKQATAAVGQAILMQIYEKFFGEYNQAIAQILLTKDIMDDDIKRTNAKNTFCTLMNLNVISIVNENDCISTTEIEGFRFGDNDTLSATVAKLIEADLLIMLTDIDGLYTANPAEDPDAQLIHVVESIDDDITCAAGDTNSNQGTGGMATKIIAAEITTCAGIDTVIANGDDMNNIYTILEGEDVGTWFKTSH